MMQQAEGLIAVYNAEIDARMQDEVARFRANAEAQGRDVNSPTVQSQVEQITKRYDGLKSQYAAQMRADATKQDEASALQREQMSLAERMAQAEIDARKAMQTQQLNDPAEQIDIAKYLQGLFGGSQQDQNFFNAMYGKPATGPGDSYSTNEAGYWSRPASINYLPGQSPWAVAPGGQYTGPTFVPWSSGGGGGGGGASGMSGFGGGGNPMPGNSGGFGYNAGPQQGGYGGQGMQSNYWQ